MALVTECHCLQPGLLLVREHVLSDVAAGLGVHIGALYLLEKHFLHRQTVRLLLERLDALGRLDALWLALSDLHGVPRHVLHAQDPVRLQARRRQGGTHGS